MKLGICKRSEEYITINKCTKNENVNCHRRDHATKRKRFNSGRLIDLPLNMIYEILSRLPAESLFSFLCVCKTFFKFHPECDLYFSQVHLNNAPNDERCLILQDRYNASNILFVNMSDFESLSPPWNNDSSACGSRPWKTLVMPTHLSKPSILATDLVGSCNGLVCINYSLKPDCRHMFCVCNPILGEFMVLPQPWPDALFSAFGYCPKSKQYKVLCFTSPSICEIHTLGTDYWSKICNFPFPRSFNYIDSSSLNGNIPWITETSKVSEIVCSFNCETEQYVFLSPPAHFFTIDTFKRMAFMRVGLLGGLFCISYLLDNSRFEVCVMKCYGVVSSWTKEICVDMSLEYRLLTRGINHYLYLRLYNPYLFTIRLLNNGEMLLEYFHDALVYYSPRNHVTVDVTGQYREVTSRYKSEEVYGFVEIVPSFISLKNTGKPVCVEVVQREKLQSFWPRQVN